MRRPNLLLLGAGGVAAAGVGWAIRDYRAWRALGPGGLPATWAGWWRMTRLRVAKRDPLALAPLASRWGADEDGLTLADLPARTGRRPRVAPHPVPHRQLDAHAPAPVVRALQALFDRKVVADPARLSWATSHFEKRIEAITLAQPCRRHEDALIAQGEIGHVHPSDGSMHMILSPSDTRIVVERGWGERHALAGVRLGLPQTYTMIYAPRDEGDLAAVSSILDAAITYMASDRGVPAKVEGTHQA
ncbi:hypothetical protein [Sphingomonas sp.]|uniref:luciferase domain-containing protein n=1 Tax=Sphingomonas sp. TaxID=28214 RepID=UPI0035BBAF9E